MKKVLILYDYFFPAFKAGGPIQSLVNLVKNLNGDFNFYVITQNKDFGSTLKLEGIDSNRWLKNSDLNVNIYYVERLSLYAIYKEIKFINPDIIFSNGIYSIPFTIMPAVFFKKKTIVHLRGMLLPGALKIKKTKKWVFISLCKSLGIFNNVDFSVSDENELFYAKPILPKESFIYVTQNFPSSIGGNFALNKEVNCLKIVSIALISPMKNHLLVLKSLQKVTSFLVYDIYGPIKDQNYWNQCLEIIEKLPENIIVNYMGEIPPVKVKEVLSNYHVFILPSESENFGHAIYEAFASGLPVITSKNTPWNLLFENNCGINTNLEEKSIFDAINYFVQLDNDYYLKMTNASKEFANNSIDFSAIRTQYLKMLNGKHTN